MSMREIDCRKLNCPEPVLRTKKALEENQGCGIQVIVDNVVARDNILRYAQSRGLRAEWTGHGDDYAITIAAPGVEPDLSTGEALLCPSSPQEQVILITSDQLGEGSEELGALLMRNLIYTLTKRDRLPRALIFMNSGVRLCTEGSTVLEEMNLLESSGLEILVCGTCLDYFGLNESLRVGTISNMYDIAELLLSAAVVSL